MAIVILQVHLGRRGREGIDLLKKTDFEIFEHPTVGRYFQKIVGESSKNHKSDSEVLEAGGVIMFETNHFGLNCGQYLKDYIAKLDPTCEFMFPRPIRESKYMKGNLHVIPIWYECTKVGVNHVAKSLPEVSSALGLFRYTNNRIRPTTIQFLKRAGFSDREIMNITGNFQKLSSNEVSKVDISYRPQEGWDAYEL